MVKNTCFHLYTREPGNSMCKIWMKGEARFGFLTDSKVIYLDLKGTLSDNLSSLILSSSTPRKMWQAKKRQELADRMKVNHPRNATILTSFEQEEKAELKIRKIPGFPWSSGPACSLLRTAVKMISSFSFPWKASTELTSPKPMKTDVFVSTPSLTSRKQRGGYS